MMTAQNTGITFQFIGMNVDFMSAQYTIKGAKHEKHFYGLPCCHCHWAIALHGLTGLF
jgi:hypothetical protein